MGQIILRYVTFIFKTSHLIHPKWFLENLNEVSATYRINIFSNIFMMCFPMLYNKIMVYTSYTSALHTATALLLINASSN